MLAIASPPPQPDRQYERDEYEGADRKRSIGCPVQHAENFDGQSIRHDGLHGW
jgi:hypothetical protein